MKKTILSVFMIFCFSLFSFAQDSINWRIMGNNKGVSFYDVQKDFNNYWKDKTPSRSRGYKPFKRWESYMAERVYPSGNMNLPSSTYANFMEWQKRDNANRHTATTNTLTSNWSEIGPVGSPVGPTPYPRTGAGRLNFVRFTPDLATMFVGAPDGGLWKSTTNGASWTTNTDFLTIIGCADLVIHPTTPNTMYLATGDVESDRKSIGILKSINGGSSWDATSLTFALSDEKKITRLLMDPTDPQKMIAATNSGVYYTTDGWATNAFSAVDGTSPNLYDMELKPGTPSTVYAAGTGVYTSTDFGTTWTAATGLPPSDVVRIALGVSPDNSNYVYALVAKSDSSFKGVYRSGDSGVSFTNRSTTPNLLGYEANGLDTGGQGFYDLAIAVAPGDAEHVVVGGVNHWASDDGGSTWTNTSVWNTGEVHADVHELYYLPGTPTTTVFSCNDGGIFKSTDNGNQWTDISSNLAISQVVAIGLSQTSSGFILSGHQDNGTNLRTGTIWNNIFGGDGGECFTDYTDNSVIYVQYVQGKYSRSDDGGVNMDPITTGLPSNIDFYSPFKIDPVTPATIYSGGTPTLYKSVNKGDNWSALGTSSGSGSILDFVVCPSNPAIIYTVQENAISKSINSGGSFSNITGSLPTTASLKSITVSNTNPDNVWVTYSGYDSTNKVYKSVDGGTSWTNISTGLPNLPMNIITYRNNSSQDEVYIGGDIGVYTTSNTATSWSSFMTGLPNVAVRDLEIYYPTNKLRAGTYGRGIWESDLAIPTTTWTGAVSTDWNIAGNWSNGVPNATTEAIISSPTSGSNLPIISNAATASKVTLNTTTTLLVTATNSLTVTNEIVNNGILTLENNSNLIQTNNVANTGSGNTVVNRNSSLIKLQDYTMWSSPVNGTQTLLNFSPLTVTTPIRFNSYNPATLPDGYFEPLTTAQINAPFETGKGYLIRVANNHPTTPTVWNGVFNGKPNNGTITAPITPSQTGITGFNAIGNPYPSDLSLPLFFAANTNLTGIAYFWRKTNGAANGYGYCTLTSAGVWTTNSSSATAPPNSKISPGQAFIVQANSGSTVTFNNTMRTIENTDNFYKSSNSTNVINGIWLNLNDTNSNFSQNAIVYADGSTNGYDQGKDAKLLREQDFSIYSIFDNNNYTIQSRSVPLISSEIIPLGIKTQTNGNYSISIDHISGFFSSTQDIYIKDLLTNTIQSLSNPYTFYTSSGSIDNRFQIVYASALNTNSNIINPNDIIISDTENGIKINSDKIEIESVKIYDYTGKLLVEKNNIQNKSITIETVYYKNLLGLIQISTIDNKVIYKKIKL